jgi:uncharacterized membrane protein
MSFLLVKVILYSQRHDVMNHCDRHVTPLGESNTVVQSEAWLYGITFTKRSDMSITVTYHIMPLTVQYYCHQEEWHVYHSDLSHHASDCTVLLSLRGVTCLSQWFITSCLWLYYSITFTKRSDMSITVIHHVMPLTVQYYFHQEEWHVYHSYLSHHYSS